MAIAQRWPVEDHTPTRSESAVPRVLIADDQPDVLEALRLLLKGEGYQHRVRRLAGRRCSSAIDGATSTRC